MTTNNTLQEEETLNDFIIYGNHQQQDVLDPESTQAAHQRAKELTEKAATITDRKEREGLLWEALDCEVRAQVQGEPTHLLHRDALQNGSGAAGADDALFAGSAAFIAELLSPDSPSDTEDANEEREGDLTHVTNSVYGSETQEEIKEGGNEVIDDSATVPQIEAALPAIEEILEARTSAPETSEGGTTAEVNNAAVRESRLETQNEPVTPSKDLESVAATEVIKERERVPKRQPLSSGDVTILETSEIVVSKVEIVDANRQKRKPRKLEIKSKKKPRKLEVKSKKKPRKLEIRTVQRVP